MVGQQRQALYLTVTSVAFTKLIGITLVIFFGGVPVLWAVHGMATGWQMLVESFSVIGVVTAVVVVVVVIVAESSACIDLRAWRVEAGFGNTESQRAFSNRVVAPERQFAYGG
jgi:uncharacterized membrane protein